MMKRVLAVVAAVGLLAGCGGSKPGSGTNTQSSSAKSGAAPTVVVKNFSFTPGNLTVQKGTKVTWNFQDNTQHNVTADDNKFKSKDIQTGSYSYTFNTAGKYSYYCSIHQYMKGTITVQ
jgi:plastocyanin